MIRLVKKKAPFYLSSICILSVCMHCTAIADTESISDPYFIKTALGTGISEKLNYEDYDKRRIKNSRISYIALGKSIQDFEVDVSYYHVDKQNLNFTYVESLITSVGLRNVPITTRQKFKNRALVLSGSYNFNSSRFITPYLSLGAGVTRNKASNYYQILPLSTSLHLGRKVWQPVYTFAAGIKHRKDNLEIFLEYRHINFGNFKLNGKEISYTSSTTEVFYNASKKTKVLYNSIALGIKLLF